MNMKEAMSSIVESYEKVCRERDEAVKELQIIKTRIKAFLSQAEVSKVICSHAKFCEAKCGHKQPHIKAATCISKHCDHAMKINGQNAKCIAYKEVEQTVEAVHAPIASAATPIEEFKKLSKSERADAVKYVKEHKLSVMDVARLYDMTYSAAWYIVQKALKRSE